MLVLENGGDSVETLKETNDDFDQQASEGEQISSYIPINWTHYSL